MKDRLGRPLRDLRISVTDKCNFRCRYCMPEEIFGPDYPFLPKNRLLTFEQMTRLARIFAGLGVQKIRLTGGEPLLRRELPLLVSMLHEVEGLEEITMTTNGTLLPDYAKELKAAGLTRVNVSLDSLDDRRFGQVNGRGYPVQPVLDGIAAATEAGLEVKVNMVVQKGINDQDILPMARHFRGSGLVLRFIEYMDVGNSNGWKLDQVVSKQEIIEWISSEMLLEPVPPRYYGEVASRYRYVGSGEEIGIISSVTETFCHSCTRARLSSEGYLYTCLFATGGLDLRTPMLKGASNEALREQIVQAWQRRDDRYSEERLSHTKRMHGRTKVEMSYIGG